LDALLTKEIAPPVHPITVGVNVTMKLTSCPAGSIKGRPKLATLNSGMLALIAEIVTLVDPVLVRVTGRASLWPTTMVPNRRRVRLLVSWGVPATALVEIKPKNSAKLMTPRTERKERDRGFDWGSRITSSLKDSRQ
jgi:hypothetical protein